MSSTCESGTAAVNVFGPSLTCVPLERVNLGHVEAVLAVVPGSAGTRHRVLATLRI